MSVLERLSEAILAKRSYLCVGLDSDEKRLPVPFQNQKEGLLNFNRAIIEATQTYCVAYKINTAFYEALGARGWEILAQTRATIPDHIFTIADAKRGDIGNTAQQYATAFFENLDFDAITLNPYMGEDSIRPFLNYPNKISILLALTSNPSSVEFETLRLANGARLYETVIKTSQTWANAERLMYVVGATREAAFKRIRQLLPDQFLLVPGVGQQGGSLAAVCDQLVNTRKSGLLINASRSIIYASSGSDFQTEAAGAARAIQKVMAEYF